MHLFFFLFFIHSSLSLEHRQPFREREEEAIYTCVCVREREEEAKCVCVLNIRDFFKNFVFGSGRRRIFGYGFLCFLDQMY